MRKAFTMVEVLVCASIIFILVGMILPIFYDDWPKSPYHNGQESGRMGIEASANPYIGEPYQARKWLDGWKSATLVEEIE